jgi:hypothetical protein
MFEIEQAKILVEQIECALTLSDKLKLDFVSFRLTEARDQLFQQIEMAAMSITSERLQ